MKEFIDKLIERLGRLGWVYADYYPDETAIHRKRKKSVGYDDVISIINELAEEYKNDIEFSQKCVELAEKMNLCDLVAENVILSHKIRFLELAEKKNTNSWIPYTSGCKMPNEATRVWLSFTTPIASFVKSAWYINGHFEWDNCKRVKETPMAWKPYDIPAPYTEGE